MSNNIIKYSPSTREELQELVYNENIHLGEIDVSKWDVSSVEDMGDLMPFH